MGDYQCEQIGNKILSYRTVFTITEADHLRCTGHPVFLFRFLSDSVFGCHLDTLCHRENTTVPRFVEKCIKSVERRGRRDGWTDRAVAFSTLLF